MNGVAKSALMDLYDKVGYLIPEDVVEAARPDDSPLHRYFDWDDSVAGVKWRKVQARKLISNVTVLIEESEPVKVQAFVNVHGDRRAYYAVHQVMSDAEMRVRFLASARRDVAAMAERLRRFTDADTAALVQAMDVWLTETDEAAA